MATILINVSKKKFNKCFTTNNTAQYHIVNEFARKTLCNLFDALGNISSYNDYNAFQESYHGFSKFNKCKCSKLLKAPLEFSQGILVVVDSNTHELTIPTSEQLKWFLEKYQYSTIGVSYDEEKDIEDKEDIEEREDDASIEEVEQPQEDNTDSNVTNVTTSSNGIASSIWSFFGWK